MSRLSTNTHPLLTELVIEALNSKQIFTVNDFLKKKTDDIKKIAPALTPMNIREIRKSLLNEFAPKPLNGWNYFKLTLEKSAIIPTGVESIDKILDGGLFTNNIYELSGLPASGKTLFCLTLAKNVTANLQQSLYYLDCKNNFFGFQFKQLLTDLSADKIKDAMNRCFVEEITTNHELINSLYAIKSELETCTTSKTRIIIIDSLSCVFSQYSMDHSENNNLLTHLVNCMHYLMCEYHVVFLITNLVTQWNNFDLKSDSETVACGRFWSSIPNFKLRIEKNNDNSGTISLIKSPDNLSKRTVDIVIADNGLLC